LVADVDNIVVTMGLRRDWPNLGVISLAHSYGFSSLVLPLLLHGIPLLLAKASWPEVVRRAVSMVSSLTVPAVPAIWRAWQDAGVIRPPVRLAISAGSPLPIGLERDVFEKAGIKIHNFYGASECGGIAYDASSDPRADGSCVGAAMHRVELSVSDAGCLRVGGPAVGETYWPEAEAQLRRGAFETNDLAELQGHLLYLRGRATDVINVAGRKLPPEIVEQALQKHPGVKECLVIGVPCEDSGRGERVVAVISLHNGCNPSEVKSHLIGQVSSWQLPRDWWVVDSINSNARGKVSRREWRERYRQERPTITTVS
jgi:acyl-CoA synthetase (AMP-forming)/AMP-acid ligase II